MPTDWSANKVSSTNLIDPPEPNTRVLCRCITVLHRTWSNPAFDKALDVPIFMENDGNEVSEND